MIKAIRWYFWVIAGYMGLQFLFAMFNGHWGLMLNSFVNGLTYTCLGLIALELEGK